VAKKRRGGYVFLTYKGDHSPRHVHVFADRGFVVKWDLENDQAMEGEADRRLRKLLRQMVEDGDL
jgi:hypothetical protein